jgi:uncharacterized membrane protein YfcA
VTLAASLVGGLVGGWLLIRTTDHVRQLLLVMLAAAVTFTIGGRVADVSSDGAQSRHAASPRHLAPTPTPLWILLFQFVIAFYGGYFGGGMIMMLAAFSVAGMADIEMNGSRPCSRRSTALVEFIADGAIAWAPD